MYDTKCYDLAQSFLSDEPAIATKGNAGELAQRIQDVIEEFIQEKNAAPVQVHPGKTILSSDGWE